MFTIKVKKREADEEFCFEDIRKEAKVFHEDCYRGKVVWDNTPDQAWQFTCQRCKNNREIYEKDQREARLAIIKTVLDGKKRRVVNLDAGIQVVRRKT